MPPDHEEQSMAYQAWLEVLNEKDYQDLVYPIILIIKKIAWYNLKICKLKDT